MNFETDPGKNIISRCVVMEDPFGFHVRPAALFAAAAQKFAAKVIVSKKEGPAVNGKSILGLLTLEIMHGDEVVVAACGLDAADAISTLERLFTTAFDHHEPQDLPNSNILTPPVPCVSQLEHDRVCA